VLIATGVPAGMHHSWCWPRKSEFRTRTSSGANARLTIAGSEADVQAFDDDYREIRELFSTFERESDTGIGDCGFEFVF
jgi:hypothetical protein